jgi:uncharacterized protein
MKMKLFWGVGIILVLVMAFLAGCSSQSPTTSTVPLATNTAPVVNTAPSVPAAVVPPPTVVVAAPPAEAPAMNINVGSQQTGIWVNGQGKITVTPDIATLTLGVSAQTLTVAEAQSQAAAAMAKVMAALTGSGVDKKDIQTQNYSIQQVTRWDDKSQQEVVLGFRVSNTVVAKLRAMDKIGSIIDASVAAGGDYTRINGINFSVEHPEQYNTQVRELAMKDAKAKADQIAALAGVTLGKPTYVSESSYTPATQYPVAYKMDAAGGAAVSTPITPGETDLTLSVQVTYSIQ